MDFSRIDIARLAQRCLKCSLLRCLALVSAGVLTHFLLRCLVLLKNNVYHRDILIL